MGGYYDEIEIEDMTFDEVKKVYHYPCPCGDRFEITKAQLRNYEDIATCPSCSLIIRVIYDPLDFEDEEEDAEEDEAESAEASEEDEEESDKEIKVTQEALKKLDVADVAKIGSEGSGEAADDAIGGDSKGSKDIAKTADAVAGEENTGSRFGAVFHALGM